MWKPINTAPEGVLVMTRITDDNGNYRMEQSLRRRGNLWFTPDEKMYVYYAPTEWREMTKEDY